MGAPFDNLAVLKHHYGVGMADGGETVSDYKGSLALHKTVKAVFYVLLGAGVDRAGGFIEHENGRVCDGGAGNVQKLALTLGKV